MKKYIISFIVFCVAFAAALGIIYYQANPAVRLSDEQLALEWHGRIENEFGTYSGTLLGDLFDGKGDFEFLSGETYTGDWQDSLMSGNGVVTFPEIGSYTGKMNGSKRNGQGTFVWLSGDMYEGNWENDAMSGKGKYTFSNGGTFDGTFESNKPISGIYTHEIELPEDAPETDVCYLQYTFTDSQKHVEFHTKGGLKYDGDFSALISTGSATITYPSGNVYVGELSAGQRQGKGMYTWKDRSGTTTAYYDGNWELDSMNGQGEYHYSNSTYPYLSGSFSSNVPDGTLTYYKEAGNTFETKWTNGTCTSIKET